MAPSRPSAPKRVSRRRPRHRPRRVAKKASRAIKKIFRKPGRAIKKIFRKPGRAIKKIFKKPGRAIKKIFKKPKAIKRIGKRFKKIGRRKAVKRIGKRFKKIGRRKAVKRIGKRFKKIGRRKAVKKVGRSVKRLFRRRRCFAPETPVKLLDGRVVSMKDLHLGDILVNGSVVKATMQIRNENDPYYKLPGGIFVTGSHYIEDSGTFIRVSKCSNSIPTMRVDKTVYCLVTSDHRIPVGDYVFWDWEDNNLIS